MDSVDKTSYILPYAKGGYSPGAPHGLTVRLIFGEFISFSFGALTSIA